MKPLFQIKIQIHGLSADSPAPAVLVEVVPSVDDSVSQDKQLEVLTVIEEVNWQYLLRRAGLTEKDLAEQAGIGLRIIQDWKKRKKMPRLDTATAVADVLGATLDEIAACMGLPRR
jgi:DNA-binding XRE family transcriptional regulator